MARLPNKPLLEVFQNGTLEEVAGVVDFELKSLGEAHDVNYLMRYLRHQSVRMRAYVHTW